MEEDNLERPSVALPQLDARSYLSPDLDIRDDARNPLEAPPLPSTESDELAAQGVHEAAPNSPASEKILFRPSPPPRTIHAAAAAPPRPASAGKTSAESRRGEMTCRRAERRGSLGRSVRRWHAGPRAYAVDASLNALCAV